MTFLALYRSYAISHPNPPSSVCDVSTPAGTARCTPMEGTPMPIDHVRGNPTRIIAQYLEGHLWDRDSTKQERYNKIQYVYNFSDILNTFQLLYSYVPPTSPDDSDASPQKPPFCPSDRKESLKSVVLGTTPKQPPPLVTVLSPALSITTFTTSPLTPLTDSESALVNSVLYSAGNSEEIISSYGRGVSDSVRRSSMQTLRPGQWLNDEVIHYFITLLGVRDARLSKHDPKRRRSHFFKSFFMTKLLMTGHKDTRERFKHHYNEVKRWGNKVHGK